MTTETLADALPAEMQRVRGVISLYREIGDAGIPAAMMMEAALLAADRASASGDVIAMLRALENLRGWKA